MDRRSFLRSMAALLTAGLAVSATACVPPGHRRPPPPKGRPPKPPKGKRPPPRRP